MVMEPEATGTRCAEPISLPASSGITRPMALAAPVLLGTDVDRAGSCAAEISFSMRSVQDHLITGVCVNRSHKSGTKLAVIIQSLCHRSQAVRGAASAGYNQIILLQSLMIYTVYDGRQVIASRCGDQYLSLRRLPDVPGILPWMRRNRYTPEQYLHPVPSREVSRDPALQRSGSSHHQP